MGKMYENSTTKLKSAGTNYLWVSKLWFLYFLFFNLKKLVKLFFFHTDRKSWTYQTSCQRI